ncbi:BppU family phage baseplate upper protein [Lactobacillus sp. ESL0225]|uniref:BppU family phage baseplate upper protein n=1 Tax=Lactobacillus sp. ESL0225 TaxID=2069351 RepID=UPI000EFD43D4|nr:BppU family phage baseplate upper protein [Lactobacillus sp. ESL0225]RMC47738.1 DUF2479 domain-containing protein [Lactobacillus sp. ESL0225]
MSIPLLTLQTDKNTTSVDVDRITIRQSEGGLILKANLVSSTGSAYDLTNCKISFGENKNGGKMVADDNIQVINAKAGQISYKLHTSVYQESGSAWFEIEDDTNKLIDTTTNFFIEVLKQADLPTENENYWSKAELMLTHVQAYMNKTKADLDKYEADNKGTIDRLVSDTNNTLQAYKDKLADYNAKYQNLENAWNSKLTQLDAKATQDFKSQRDNFNAQFVQFENDLKSDLNNKLGAISTQVNQLQNNTLPDLTSKANAISTKLDQIKTDFNKIDFTNFVTKNDWNALNGKVTGMYDNATIDRKLADAGKLKTVNGQAPDGYGNVNIKIPSDYVKSVNGVTPDGYGNVTVDSGGVKKVNGKSPNNGNALVSMYAANLLKGTTEQPRDIPPNTATDVIHLTTEAYTKYTVAVDIDYTAFSSGSAGCKLQVNNGGGLVDSATITAGSKGRVSVTFTTPASCYWVTVLLTSNSSYTGKYSCMKASQWQDADTPPEMTWVPAIEDYRSDISVLSSRIDYLQNKINSSLQTYSASDYASGVAYSKSHPNVLVLI